MADFERSVLEFYQLSTLYPNEWPADKNNSDSSDEESEIKKKINRRKSKYQALERAVSNRASVVPGSEQSAKGGVGNLVQKDEPDPLGTTDSVVRTLRQLGVAVQDDTRLRMRLQAPCSSCFRRLTGMHRQQVSPFIDDLLARPFPVRDACDGRHAESAIWSGRALAINRSEVGVAQSAR